MLTLVKFPNFTYRAQLRLPVSCRSALSKLKKLNVSTRNARTYVVWNRIDSIAFYFFLRRSQRTDWRKERKLNSETFGVASTRRGGFRGRGYYSRGMGGMYRGGGGGAGSSGPMGGGPMGAGPQGAGGFRGAYRGQRGGNRKPQGATHPHNRNDQHQPASQQQQQQQSTSNRLVTGTA